MQPHACKAVRLQLRAHQGSARAGVLVVDLGEDSRLVLNRMAEFVGHDVGLGQPRVRRSVPGLELLEEADVEVDGFVRGAVEGAGLGAGGSARGGGRAGEEHEIGLFVCGAGGGGKRAAPVGVQGLGGGDHPALGVLVRVFAGLARFDERGLVSGGLTPRGAQVVRNLPRQEKVDDGPDESEAADAGGRHRSAPANLDSRGIQLNVVVHGHVVSISARGRRCAMAGRVLE